MNTFCPFYFQWSENGNIQWFTYMGCIRVMCKQLCFLITAESVQLVRHMAAVSITKDYDGKSDFLSGNPLYEGIHHIFKEDFSIHPSLIWVSQGPIRTRGHACLCWWRQSFFWVHDQRRGTLACCFHHWKDSHTFFIGAWMHIVDIFLSPCSKNLEPYLCLGRVQTQSHHSWICVEGILRLLTVWDTGNGLLAPQTNS